MPDWLRFPLTLVVVGVLSGLLLSFLDGQTREVIKAHRQEAAQKAVAEVLPGMPATEERRAEIPAGAGRTEKITYTVGFAGEAERKAGGPVLGWALDGAGKGYGPEDVVVKAGFKAGPGGEPVLIAVKVVQQAETPGFGSKVTEAQGDWNVLDWLRGRASSAPPRAKFLEALKGRPAAEAKLRADGGSLDGISGATITSRAVCRAVQDAARKMKEILAREGGR